MVLTGLLTAKNEREIWFLVYFFVSLRHNFNKNRSKTNKNVTLKQILHRMNDILTPNEQIERTFAPDLIHKSTNK